MTLESNSQKPLSWLFGSLLFIIGLLNMIQVHAGTGIAYLLVSLLFFPPINILLHNKLNVSIPFVFKVILFVLIMWATLGVGDLAEIYGL